MKARAEWAWGGVIAVVAFALRVWLVERFPTQPVSDFAGLLRLAEWLRDHGLASPHELWRTFNGGTSTTLALVLRLVPGSPLVVARAATLTATALVSLVPFVMLRGVFGLRIRVVVGLLLATWPVGVCFAGVIAQDNWVLLPSVTLASLAIRAWRTGRHHPVLGALLWLAAVFVRQEMALALLPIAVAVAGLGWRRLVTFGTVAAALFGLIALQRLGGTGHFAISTAHLGDTLLGSNVPDVGGDWHGTDVFLSSVTPPVAWDAARDRHELGLALGELGRRPLHHLIRMTGGALRGIGLPDRILHWSLTADGVMPPERRALAAHFSSLAGPVVDVWAALCNGALLAALVVARRNRLVWILAAAVFLKIAVHAALVNQGRFFLVVNVLQILTVAVAAVDVVNATSRRPFAFWWVIGSLAAGGLAVAGDRAGRFVEQDDERDVQRVYRLSFADKINCEVDKGRLTSFGPGGFAIKLNHNDAAPHERATAHCHTGAATTIRLHAPPEAHQVERRLVVNGVMQVVADGAATTVAPDRDVTLEVEMLDGTGNWTWTPAGVTEVDIE